MRYNDGMARALLAQPARREDLAPAFRLMFRHVPAADHEARVANALYLIARGELEREGVLVVRGRRGLVGAMVGVPLRGATGLVWPPWAVDGPQREAIEDQLVQAVSAWLRQRGAKLAQALLPLDEAFLGDALVRNGFLHVTRLQYLQHDLTDPAALDSRAPRLTFLPYRGETVERFHRTLMRSYEGTLDCPELNGVRSVAEIIDGHKGQGIHDPDRWWLAEEAGQPVGVLLLADVPDLGGWDLSYVGVVPEARGRGVGRALTRLALDEAQAAGVDRVTLAVDMRNEPAWRMYRQLGFEAAEQREVYLAFYERGPGGQLHETGRKGG
jgi:ribosomal protein S18 acetylase RimI-like enzyme